jgi:DNA invertase Pin-like site-specific DNA recombinase
MNRPELTRCLDTLRIVQRLENSGVQFISLTEDINKKGYTLVIWKLDRLGRSLRDLIEICASLHDRPDPTIANRCSEGGEMQADLR